jgi:hypothetical protein
MSELRDALKWKIIPKSTLNVLRNCNKCKQKREFYCSNKFRVNAQQKTLDVWLIYKCLQCDCTWNLDIFSRINVNNLKSELLEKFTHNDIATAWYYAFDINTLRKNDAVILHNIDYDINGTKVDLLTCPYEKLNITSEMPYPFNLRLDKVMSYMLNISRNSLLTFYKLAIINIPSKSTNAVAHKITDQMQVNIDVIRAKEQILLLKSVS